MICQNLNSNFVFTALWNYNIGVPFGGFNKLKMTRANGFFIAMKHLAYIAAPFLNVALDNPRKPDVGIAVNINFNVH